MSFENHMDTIVHAIDNFSVVVKRPLELTKWPATQDGDIASYECVKVGNVPILAVGFGKRAHHRDGSRVHDENAMVHWIMFSEMRTFELSAKTCRPLSSNLAIYKLHLIWSDEWLGQDLQVSPVAEIWQLDVEKNKFFEPCLFILEDGREVFQRTHVTNLIPFEANRKRRIYPLKPHPEISKK